MLSNSIRKSLVCKYAMAGLSSLTLVLAACTVNPATGEKQFTAFLPASQESAIGASEHEKIQQSYGNFLTGPLATYVNNVGQKVSANTERSDVTYRFHVVDSPIVNAFALPGGYIYVSRGLLALANSEAELAAVLGHEVGHVTARHAASRVSQGTLAGLGSAILTAATGSQAVGQVASVGSDLYLKSYSRDQEHQSDDLGIRYLSRSGYSPDAMARFLSSLDAQTKLDQRLAGKQGTEGPSYFSTHPVTSDRIVRASGAATSYPAAGADTENRAAYLNAINGMVYGDSPEQGFVRGTDFYHPNMGFTFSVPNGFTIQNQPSEVIATNGAGAAVILDTGRDDQRRDPLGYLRDVWMKDNPPGNAESITVNGMRAATAGFAGTANGAPVTIRVVAIEWQPGQYFRLQMAVPQNAGTDVVEGLKRTTYSFRKITEQEKNSLRPQRIRLHTASAGDTVASVAARMAFKDAREERFRVLNGLSAGAGIVAGQTYKIITE